MVRKGLFEGETFRLIAKAQVVSAWLNKAKRA